MTARLSENPNFYTVAAGEPRDSVPIRRDSELDLTLQDLAYTQDEDEEDLEMMASLCDEGGVADEDKNTSTKKPRFTQIDRRMLPEGYINSNEVEETKDSFFN